VTVLVVAGAQTFGGVVLASLLLVTLPAVFTSSTVTEWQPVAFGAAAILFAQVDNGLIGIASPPELRLAGRTQPLAARSARNVERLARVMDGRPAAAAAGVQQ